jgi:hypothetical protein
MQTKWDPYTGKALSNHENFSPSQSYKTVHLTLAVGVYDTQNLPQV